MFLKNVKLAGFKSFVDPTTIPIRGHLNAVVGPNGCGKSNIVDAIRWVIGESSAKQLRGQSMSDVIFNGTTERKPVGRAMVELNFDNSAGRVVGEYAKYPEIVIRREVEREGQSSYFLNGTGCRRRDILDIFLGTGLGPRSYSIIEQGMISQLIEAKPEDLRNHLEEVAGISKYKERRRETGNRIRHTQENLDRLNDLREELDKQLRHLKRQANAAERYKVYKEEERVLNAEIKALHWQALEEKRASSDQKIEEKSLVREQKITLQREHEADIEKMRVYREDATEIQNEVQKRFYGLGADVARLEQQIKHTQEQMQRWQRELNETDTLYQELNEGTAEHRDQIQELESELEGLAPQSSDLSTHAETAREAFAKAEADMQLWQQEWDQFQEATSRASSEIGVAKTKIDHFRQQLQNLMQRHQTMTEQLEALPLEETQAQIDPLRVESEQLSQDLISAQEKLENYVERIASQRDLNQGLQRELQEKQSELQSLEGKRASLDALQQAALGRDDESTAVWLNDRELQSKSRLGQALQVNAEWENALETVLSGYFDAVCVEQVGDYVNALAGFQDGKITLVDATPCALENTTVTANTLANQVSSDWPFQQWLHGIYIANDIEELERVRSQLADHESVITKEGVWAGKNWIRVNRVKDPQSGILAREKQLNILTADIAELKTAIDEQEARREAGEETLAELELERESLHHEYQGLSRQSTQVQSDLSAKLARLEDMEQRSARLQKELLDLTEQREIIQEDLYAAEKTHEDLQENQLTMTAKREHLTHKRDHYRSVLEIKRKEAQQQQQQRDELEIRLTANENQLALLRQTVQRDERQLEQLTDRRELLKDNLSETDGPLEKYSEGLQEKLSARSTVEAELKTAEAALRDCNQKINELEEGRQSAADDLAAIQTSLEELRMQRQTVVVRQTTIIEQLTEAEQNLQEVIESLSEEADVKVWEERLEKLTQRINRLGAINLAAIDEYKTNSERKEYLDKQHDDLVEALEVLEAAIKKIDRETKTRFRETFDKVNEGFKVNFPKVFGGGRAFLELSDNDLLKTGVIVRAQPPGKRNTTIHMLSGGEKALTAIALVFSMFQLNPAPFCILDEVDAPLDDLNVGRFCRLVQEMAKETQFLVISHNKVTIEMADQLMGVTMHEPGVSRLVAVDMHEALEMVET